MMIPMKYGTMQPDLSYYDLTRTNRMIYGDTPDWHRIQDNVQGNIVLEGNNWVTDSLF